MGGEKVAEDHRGSAEKILQGDLRERVIAAVHRGHVDPGIIQKNACGNVE